MQVVIKGGLIPRRNVVDGPLNFDEPGNVFPLGHGQLVGLLGEDDRARRQSQARGGGAKQQPGPPLTKLLEHNPRLLDPGGSFASWLRLQ